MLAGPPKIGKSWYALNILHQVNQADHCVVFVGIEDNFRRLQSRYSYLTKDPSDNVIFYAGLSNDQPIPKGKKAYDLITDISATFNPSLIIIDTLEGIRDTNGKDNYSQSLKELTELRKLTHQSDIVILFVHHTKKKTDYEVEPLDSILGSQGIAATFDTILIMRAQTGTRDINLFVTGKDVEQHRQGCGATDKQKSQVSKIVNQLIVRDLILRKERVLICSV